MNNINITNTIINNNITNNDINIIDNLLSVNDILEDKKTSIHNELFNNAIKYYISLNVNKQTLNIISDDNKTDNELLLEKYMIIDLNDGTTYLDPTHALLISKSRPLKKIKIDLKPYWNKNYAENLNTNDQELLLINEENLNESEFESINFIDAKIYYKNKFTNKIFGIPFNKFRKNLKLNQLKNI